MLRLFNCRHIWLYKELNFCSSVSGLGEKNPENWDSRGFGRGGGDGWRWIGGRGILLEPSLSCQLFVVLIRVVTVVQWYDICPIVLCQRYFIYKKGEMRLDDETFYIWIHAVGSCAPFKSCYISFSNCIWIIQTYIEDVMLIFLLFIGSPSPLSHLNMNRSFVNCKFVVS